MFLKTTICQPTQDTDDLISDEEIARQLQMDENMEVGQLLIHWISNYSWNAVVLIIF